MASVGKSGAEDRVKALYYIMQSAENKLGGGEGIEGLYGSLTRTGMQKVLHSLSKSCGLDQSSRLVDVGAGLGRPLLHALIHPGIALGFGIEIDQIKCSKAHAFLRQSAAALLKRGFTSKELAVPVVKCSAIEKISSLDPATHAYSFWEGVPIDAKCAFGSLFAASRTLKAVAVVQRAMRQADPAEVMAELGFGQVDLVSSFAVSMSGSGRSFTAYVFNKSDKAQHAQRASVADASAAQPLCPEALNAQKVIAESPSPISTPDIMAASRLSPCQMLAGSRSGEAVMISVDATARAVESRECHDMHADQAEACGRADWDGSAHEPSEASADQVHKQAGHSQSCGIEETAPKAGNSKAVKQKQQRREPQAPVQGVRRSRRQQQLNDKQLLAEAQHTARVRTTTVATAMPSSTARAGNTTACTPVTASRIRDSSTVMQVLLSTDKSAQHQKQQVQVQRQRGSMQSTAAKAAVGNGAVGRKGKSSPTAGVKKPVSPVSKGLVGGMALGARFPLRVRRNAEQPSMKGDLNSKFADAHGLGDIASHVIHSAT
ncbi:hypothetical protein ABBQ32_010473 [Trebouxia sp. C0010 RCD-2024]